MGAREASGSGYFLTRGQAEFGEFSVRLIAFHGLEDLVEIPVALRFGRRLHLDDVHLLLQKTIGPDHAVRDEHVVDLRLLQLLHDLVRVGRPDRLDRVQIGERRRIIGGLREGRHFFRLLEEPVGELPRRIVHVPVPRSGQHEALRGFESERVDVGEEHEQRRRPHRLGEAELRAAFSEFEVSVPALARASTCAPELWAWSR